MDFQHFFVYNSKLIPDLPLVTFVLVAGTLEVEESVEGLGGDVEAVHILQQLHLNVLHPLQFPLKNPLIAWHPKNI